MIAEALIKKFNSRFQHEKRARVCLWFDEKREFSRMLPAFSTHLEQMQQALFTLLAYDPGRNHGQIWLKHRIYSTLKPLDDKKRRKQRFVIYLPLSEERLDGPDEQGQHHLELLAEYKIAGVSWQINGKRPTLFGFLKQAGVTLPSNPADQRKLWEGGADSLLAKYVAKFGSRPAAFWNTLLTPELAQSRLLGDLDQTILDFAVDPEATWKHLQTTGLDAEFLSATAERYGFSTPVHSPVDWIKAFVAMLALTETYLGYGEPTDFPFLDRLPPLPLQQHHRTLLKRWLRDAESRTAWDQWIQEAETDIDLAAWAAGKNGISFGLPHLVHQRWQQAMASFIEAATKYSKTKAFFQEHGDRIRQEAEFAQTSHVSTGAWALLHSLGRFIKACENAEAEANILGDIESIVKLYIRVAPQIDQNHLKIRQAADENGLPNIARVADGAYARYAKALNSHFFTALSQQQNSNIDGIASVTAHLDKKIWQASGKRAVVIVDALRYDCAHTIADSLTGLNVNIEALRAELPTVTPIGMTALLPISNAELSFRSKGNYPHPLINGLDMAQSQNRAAYLVQQGADVKKIEALETQTEAPGNIGDLLVVLGHDAVDDLGHNSADTIVRHIDLEIQRIVRLIRKLHRWGYETVHVITDHGFILLEEAKLPEEVLCDKNWCHVYKERYALVPATADIPLTTFPFAFDDDIRVALPPGLSFFKAEKSFSHGGATLQEMIIPHLVSQSAVTKEKRIAVEVVLPAYEMMQAAVRVTLRPISSNVGGNGQIGLFDEKGRTLALNVFRAEGEAPQSVLPSARAKEVRLESGVGEKNVTLFFHSALSFKKGELLELDIRDVETMEQFPSGGIKLTVGRDI